jgi:hypothetical protein
MTTKTGKKKADRRKMYSSISVSHNVVCKDEACIGEVVGNPNALTGEAERHDKDKGSARKPGTSMSIGGKDACTAESCIGRK